MRTRSDIWVTLAQGDFNFDAKACIGDKVYTEITAPQIDRSLMGSPLSVGNCISATLSLSILTDDVFDAKTPIVIKGRLFKGTLISEFLPFGTFFINQRSTRDGLVTVSCYDAMLKANQNYLSADDTGAGWPKPMVDVVSEIAYRIGVKIDPRTVINTGDDYMVPCPTGLTMNQVLGYIGGCHGGNWIITEDNALRLVCLVDSPDGVANVAALASEVTPDSVIKDSHYITDDAGLPIVTTDGYYLVWAEDGYVSAVDGLEYVEAVLGAIDNGNAVQVAGVVMSDTAGNTYTAGNTSGNGVIRVESNPYATQNICDTLYQKYNGLVYAPYTASQAVYDPAAELGDQVAIGTVVRSVMYQSKLNLDIGFTADIGAPNSEELGEEYPFLTKFEKLFQSTTALNESIQKTAEELEQKVNDSSTDVSQLSADLAAEVKRASGVEQELNTRIGKEETRAKNAEQNLQAEIDAEETRAKTAEAALELAIAELTGGSTTGAFATEIANLKANDSAQDEAIAALQAKDTSLETAHNGEVTRAQAAEQVLQENIDAEKSRAETAEQDLQAEIDAEETRAKAAEADLQQSIGSLSSTHNADIAALQQVISEQATLIEALTTRLGQDEAAIADLTERLAALEG